MESSSLPFAVRIAAGLLSEAVGRARRLPADLTTLPVTVIGQVAKFSFELNQQLAELATQGDRLLAGLHSEDAPTRTAWSTIDDEEDVAARDPQAATWDTTAPDAPSGPEPATTPSAGPTGAAGLVLDDEVLVAPASPRLVPDEDAPAAKPSARRPRAAGRRVGTTGGSAGTSVGDSAGTSAGDSAGTSVGDSVGDSVGVSVDDATSTPPGDAANDRTGTRRTDPDDVETPMDRALLDDVEELEVQRPAPLVGLPSMDADPGSGAETVSEMTIGQLRSRVRSWGSEEVRAALEQEQRGKARPAFLTVLTNRLSTLARGGA